MKHLKILGIAAVAAMALMAFAASSASATALYNGSTKLGSGSVIDFSLASGKKAILKETGTEGRTLDECSTSTVKGKIGNAGGASATVTGSIETLSWESCSVPTATTKLGELEVHWTEATKGTLTAKSEIGVTVNTIFFGSCVYGVVAGNSIGTLQTFSSGAATMNANAIAKKLSGSSFACPETTNWTGTYQSTEPVNLRVEKE